MTYNEYIATTKKNVELALKNYSPKELESGKALSLLPLDDYVTGASIGRCLNATADDYSSLSELVVDHNFLDEVSKYKVDMTVIFGKGPEIIDVLARRFALTHVEAEKLIEEEIKSRKKKQIHGKEGSR